MKSYRQFCALSRALDVIGDRWTMLIVRELLIGPSRYSDLHKSLPGIATNLLADRLRTLEDAGVTTSTEEAAPISARVYSLTDWGRALQTPLVELARWGVPLMATGTGDDHHKGRWMIFALMALFPKPDALPSGSTFPTLTVRIDVDGDSLLLASGPSGVTATTTSADTTADVTLQGTPDDVFHTLSHHGTADPRARVTGDPTSVDGLSELTALALTAVASA